MTTTGNKTIVGDLEVLGANMGDPRMRNLIMYSRLGAQARLPSISDFGCLYYSKMYGVFVTAG
jgi:hypothetical protein